MPILYNLRTAHEGFLIAKFNEDFNVEAFYNLRIQGKALVCDCPAGERPTCRHRKMVTIFAKRGAIDGDEFYCYETQAWHRPIPALLGEPAEPLAAKAVDAARTPISTEPADAGEGPGPSTLAVDRTSSPSQDRPSVSPGTQPSPGLRGGPATSSRLRRPK